MKRTLPLLLALILVLSSSSCSKEKPPVVTSTPEEMYYDIERIKIDLSTSSCKALYDPAPFEQVQEELLAGKLGRIDCIYRLQSILSGFNIAHIKLAPEYSDYEYYDKVLPVYMGCSGNDYYIISAVSKYEKYLGWKLAGIGGVTAKEANARIASFNSFETEAGAKYALEGPQYQSALKQAGLLERNGKVRFELESPAGKKTSVGCKLIDTENCEWIRLKTADNPYVRKDAGNDYYYLTLSPDNRTLYVHFDSVALDSDYSISSFVAEILDALETGAYDTVVWDVRNNSGGYIRVINDMRLLLYRNKDVFGQYNQALVATGKTYSAACEFLDRFLAIFPDTPIFGEETGQAVFNYTSTYPYKLQKLNCMFMYPTVVDSVPSLEERSSDVLRGTLPDVEVLESLPKWMNGSDSIYEAIEAYFHK